MLIASMIMMAGCGSSSGAGEEAAVETHEAPIVDINATIGKITGI